MSSHAATKIDQKEYLKKYLSGDKSKKKKKDKKHKRDGATKVKIIDDDASAFPNEEIDEELLLGGEDAPQIVGEYIEERPSGASAPKWRSIAVKDEPADEDIKKEPTEENDLWGRKASDIKIKDEFSSTRRTAKEKQKQRTPDISPPRRKHKNKRETDRKVARRLSNSRDSSQSPGHKRKHSPKKHKRQSPPRRRRRSPDLDQTPPRQRQRSREPDQTPPRRGRKNLDSDHSPQRRRELARQTTTSSNSRDQSPPRRRQRSADSDQSPPRRSNHNKESDQSPPRMRNRRRDSDESPPRRRCKSPDSDQSPPRRRDYNNRQKRAQSPARRRRNNFSNQSPPRRCNSDQSPPRRRRSPISIKREKFSPEATTAKRGSDSPPPTHKPKPGKTLDGKKAGLQDAAALKAENERRRQQEERLFAEMSGDVSGRNAEVRVRSTGRKGRRARDAEAEDPEVRRRKEEHERKKKELYDRWGKGLKQVEDHRKRLEEQAYESSKPLARYSNDEDLERHLREQERADDPMLEYMRQKRKKNQEEKNVPTKPVYEGSYPENRFGIRPGYRWDGVDRSNGYEKRWFDAQNERKAVQEEAYKYSVEDM